MFDQNKYNKLFKNEIRIIVVETLEIGKSHKYNGEKKLFHIT